MKKFTPFLAVLLLASCSAGTTPTPSTPNPVTPSSSSMPTPSGSPSETSPNPSPTATPTPIPTPTPTPALPQEDLATALSRENHKTIWSLAVQYEDEDYPIQSKEQKLAKINDGSLKVRVGQSQEEIDKYKSNVVKFIENNFLLDYLPNTYYNYGLANFREGKTLYFNDIALDTVYNTLQLDSKERAGRVIQSNVIPVLKRLGEAFAEDTDLDYIGLIFYFGSKNFLDDSVLATKAEALAFFVEPQTLAEFIKGEITDSELIDNSILFLSDRDNLSFARTSL